MIKCSISFIFRELQIKIMRYHFISITMAEIQKTDNTKCPKDAKQQELSFIADRNATWYSHFGRHLGSLSQN